MSRKTKILIPIALIVFAAIWVFLPLPGEPLRISRETTFITGPLGLDGFPDAGAALELLHGGAIPAEDNVVAGLTKVFRLGELDEETRSDFLTRLGLSPDSTPTNPLVSLEETDEANQESKGGEGPSGDSPWDEEDWPAYRQWLSRNRIPLQVACDALERERSFWPSPGQGVSRLAAFKVGDVDARELARLLTLRAWSRVESAPASAVSDSVALLRLASVLGDRYGYFGMRTASRIGKQGRAIARYAMERGLEDIPALTLIAEVTRDERPALARLEEHRITLLAPFYDADILAAPTLRRINQHLDRYEAVLRLPLQQQEEALDLFEQAVMEERLSWGERSEFFFVANTFLRPPGRLRIAYISEALVAPYLVLTSPNIGFDPTPGAELAVLSLAAHALRVQARLGRPQ